MVNKLNIKYELLEVKIDFNQIIIFLEVFKIGDLMIQVF